MQRRRVMLSTGKPPRLPREYQEVEYLQSSGTQYIDTGFIVPRGTTNLIIETDIAYTQLDIGRQLSGADNMQWIGISGHSWDLGQTAGSISLDTFYHAVTEVYINQSGYRCGRVTIDGSVILDVASSATSIAHNRNLIFSINVLPQRVHAKIKKWVIEADGITYRNFIPCYRKSDHKPGMYDLVTKTFFTNSGTGEFLVGPDVN